MIGEDSVSGIPVLVLGSGGADGIEARFAPGAGMVCCSLRHRGEELLGQRHGLDGYVRDRSTMGIPFLYPWANRLALPRFEAAGAEIDTARADPPPKLDGHGLPIHGLLTAAPGWRVDRHEDTGDGAVLLASFRFADGDPLAAGFPFPHTVELQARVSGASLALTTSVHADAGSPVPVSFGFHPYFALPGLPRRQWEIDAPLTEQLELDARGLPTGRRSSCEPITGPLGERSFDDAYLAPRDGAAISLAGGGRRIAIRFGPGYPFAQIYAPPGEELIAIEPMTAPTNALVGGGSELPVVEPGGTFSARFEIVAGID